MRLHEFSNPLKQYMATVRVVLRDGSTTARTAITAESSTQAFVMLCKIFGKSNVMSLTQIVSEASETDQIQLEAMFRPLVVRRHVQPRKHAQIKSSQDQQQSKRSQKQQVSAKPIAASIKHKLIQDKLTKHFMRQSNIVKPTTDDVRIAHDRAETELKRADLEFKKRSEAEQRRQERNVKKP